MLLDSTNGTIIPGASSLLYKRYTTWRKSRATTPNMTSCQFTSGFYSNCSCKCTENSKIIPIPAVNQWRRSSLKNQAHHTINNGFFTNNDNLWSRWITLQFGATTQERLTNAVDVSSSPVLLSYLWPYIWWPLSNRGMVLGFLPQ